ncbi:MAG: sugar phosphate isomerase/epimerase [Nitrososphaera sp.]
MMMKYSITLASFRKIEPIEETLARLAKQGFDAVEMYGEPEEVDLKKLKDALSTARLPVCGITGMWGRASTQGWKRKLLSTDHSLVTASEKYVKDCIRMCSQLGGKEMNICLFANEIAEFDKTHGTITIEQKKQILSRASPMLRKLCKEARDSGISLVLEPLNRYSTPYCATASDALLLARHVDNLGILLDTFHMNIEEDSFEEAIFASRDFLVHTHFADNNRKMPGFAHINFKTIVTSLQKISYDGYVSFEPNIADRNYEYVTKKGLEFIREIEAFGRVAAA